MNASKLISWIVVAVLLSSSTAIVYASSTGDSYGELNDTTPTSGLRLGTNESSTIIQGYTDEEILEAFELIIQYANQISFTVDEYDNVNVSLSPLPPATRGGTTGVETWYDGIIIKLDSTWCYRIVNEGTDIAAAALIGALGAAIGSAIPVLGTAIGGAVFSVIGYLVVEAIKNVAKVDQMNFDSGVAVKIKLIGHAYGIPYPFPPTIVSVTRQ